MILAELAPASGNVVITGFALTTVIGFLYGAILWHREGQMERHEDKIADHDEQLATLAYQMTALLEDLGREIPAPSSDDSPDAEEPEWQTNPVAYRITDPELHALEVAAAEEIGPLTSFIDYDPDPATDEFPPVQPDTAPMALIVDPTPAVQARRDAAWDTQRPSPVPRGRSADWVEDAIKGFNFSGRDR